MTRLQVIHEEVRRRTEATTLAHADWPCRKGCDECCRRLAAVPRLTGEEWQLVRRALDELPPAIRASVLERIAGLAGATRPITCPMLDPDSGSCLIYEARPVFCRTYGFYVDREGVLGCSRIEALSRQSPDIIWGNHESIESSLALSKGTRELPDWLFTPDAVTPSE